jgi:hypothetical protein
MAHLTMGWQKRLEVCYSPIKCFGLWGHAKVTSATSEACQWKFLTTLSYPHGSTIATFLFLSWKRNTPHASKETRRHRRRHRPFYAAAGAPTPSAAVKHLRSDTMAISHSPWRQRRRRSAAAGSLLLFCLSRRYITLPCFLSGHWRGAPPEQVVDASDEREAPWSRRPMLLGFCFGFVLDKKYKQRDENEED